MEKQSLPKLEIEGFTIYPSGRGSYRPENDASGAAGKASWRDRASRMVGRKGRAAGKASGDRDLEAEGKADQTEGKVKQAGEHVKDAAKDVKDGLTK